jgi:hypothetical protein
VALAYKLEAIVESEGIKMADVEIVDWDAFHEDGPNYSGVQIQYQSTV